MEDKTDNTSTQFGSIHSIGEVTDEFGVKYSKFVANLSFKSLKQPSINLPFTVNQVSSQNPSILTAPSIPLLAGGVGVIFELQCDHTYASLAWKKYTLFIMLDGTSWEDTQFIGIMVSTECPCLLPIAECCENHEYNFLKISTSPTEVFSHTHNILVQHVPGIITVKFSFIDVSRAALKPLGIIELEAYQNCEKVLEPLTKDIENIPSYDILIACKNGEKIPAHVSILRARSPYFQEILPGSNPPERPTRIGWIDEDTSNFAMKVILHFVYSGSLQADWMKDADGVIGAAAKFKLDELQQMFENLLISLCNRTNVHGVNILAQKYGLVNLQTWIQKEFLTEEDTLADGNRKSAAKCV